MIEFDIEGLKALTWVYAIKEGIITPHTWEKNICKSVNGTHIPGDTYMADGIRYKSGLNIKTIQKVFTKKDIQTLSYVQCRCPLNESSDIGTGVIKTLVDKREESFEKFGLDEMIDVIVIHNRIGNEYNVRLFAKEQIKYENINFQWHNGYGYLNSAKNKKNWKIRRVPGDASAFQTCVWIKKVFDVQNCLANFSVMCDNEYDISMKEAKQKYAEIQSK
jgi:hypothetical protein